MVAEHAAIDLVHLRKLADIDQKHAAAQHVLKARARGDEDRLDVLEALLGLRLDVGAREDTRARIPAPWPDTNTSRSNTVAGEYGPMGAGMSFPLTLRCLLINASERYWPNTWTAKLPGTIGPRPRSPAGAAPARDLPAT